MKDIILDEVKRIISKSQNSTIDSISTDAKFINDLGYDSLEAVEFVQNIEDRFEIDTL